MVIDFLEMMRKLVRCNNISMTVIQNGASASGDFDLGIRKTLLEHGENEHFLKLLYELGEEGVLYYVTDYFDTEYCIMRIPQEERSYGDFIILGPYRDMLFTEVQLSELIEQKKIPIDYANELKEYYHAVPAMPAIDQWRETCITLCRILYQEKAVQVQYVVQNSLEKEFHHETGKDDLSFKMIEERYAAEGEVMKAISTQLAKRIETINSSQEAGRFKTEMLRKYCLLVRNYSLRGCSPVVQKVVNHINLNLTEDLSLKRLAVEYSVNASYLSALFKKDMGVTLTDYSQQRVRKAITLINSSDMQIQDIASESGIYDVNYFRKLFKKITGKTPTEYVKQVRTHGAM